LSPSRPDRSEAIDVLKGIAIIGVLLQHALAPEELRSIFTAFHLGLAVPVFVLLTGMNLTGSLQRTGSTSLGQIYTRVYVGRRVGRLLPPLVVAWGASLVLGIALGRLAMSPQLALLSFPMPGPGDYYIPVLLQMVLVTPVVFWAMSKRPGLTIAICFGLDIGFEFIANHVDAATSILGGNSRFRYDVVGLRYFGVLAIGVWIGVRSAEASRRATWLWVLAVLGVVYLLVERAHGQELWLGMNPGFERRTTVAIAGLAAVWALAGMRVLNGVPRSLRAPLVVIGIASYHVYLVQIVWFGVFPQTSWLRFAVAVVCCCAIGVAFHWALPGGVPDGLRRRHRAEGRGEQAAAPSH
jgi:peptidoglycan/LPS O-acetylase OafA/YrhL